MDLKKYMDTVQNKPDGLGPDIVRVRCCQSNADCYKAALITALASHPLTNRNSPSNLCAGSTFVMRIGSCIET